MLYFEVDLNTLAYLNIEGPDKGPGHVLTVPPSKNIETKVFSKTV